MNKRIFVYALLVIMPGASLPEKTASAQSFTIALEEVPKVENRLTGTEQYAVVEFKRVGNSKSVTWTLPGEPPKFINKVYARRDNNLFADHTLVLEVLHKLNAEGYNLLNVHSFASGEDSNAFFSTYIMAKPLSFEGHTSK